jgi:hypothetical protein
MKYITSLVVAVFIAICTPVFAKSSRESHIASMTETLESIKSHGIANITGSLHPSELQKIRDLVIELIELEINQGQNKLQMSLFGSVQPIEKIKSIDNYTIVVIYLDAYGSEMTKANTIPMFTSFSILSTTREKNLIHTLIRTKSYAPPNSISAIIELSSVKDKGGWKIVLPSSFEIYARLLDKSVYKYAMAIALMLGLDPSVTEKNNN